MIKKIIVFIIIVLIIWLVALYFNKTNEPDEIIIGDYTETQDNKAVDNTILAIAQTYCAEENVASVYISTSTIKIDSSLLGGGSTYISTKDNTSISCPVVGPDSITQECKEIAEISEEEWEEVCANTTE